MVITPEILFRFQNATSDSAGNRNDYLQFLTQLTNGSSGAGAMDVLYARVRTVTNSGTPDTIDLNAGTIVGSDFSVASFAKVGLIVVAHFSTASTFTIGQGSNPFATWLVGTTPGIKLYPAQSATVPSYFVWCCTGATIAALTGGSADTLTVSIDTGTNVSYLVALCGRSV